jgi:hypothetical protein
MKNIHLIQTDKPSRLTKQGDDLEKIWLYTRPIDFRANEIYPQNIYITDNSEIKEGDWFYNTFNDNQPKLQKRKGDWRTCFNQHKIILTTDPDLIQDGVQEIDNEFLEWFVKNPSCEYVTVYDGIFGDDRIWKKYIIIPQEEPKESAMDKDSIDKFLDSLSDDELKEKWNKYNKHSEQENSVTISEFIKNIKQEGYICPHTKIQCDDECCLSVEDCHLLASIDILSEPKQQSLTYSEASKKEERIFNSNIVIKEMKQWKNFVINGLKNLIKVNKPSVRKS